jgi:threonine dehydrogenase-like Zn-dependent dehydrogenase
MHGPALHPDGLDRMAAGELRTSHLATHSLPLDEAPRAYDLFKHKTDGCVRAVVRPGG